MSYVSSLYHIIFTTRNRQAVITPQYQDDLYRIMASIILKSKSKALLINGVEDHIHILLSLSPEVALSDMMRDLKSQSSLWMRKSTYYPMFNGWEQEYGAFSLSDSHKDAVYNYIKSQPEHHKNCGLKEEFERLVLKNGLVFYEW